MSRIRRPLRIVLGGFVLIVLAIAACNYTPVSHRKPSMIALSPRLESLFQHTRTVCFGRYVIEVPSTATLVFGSAYVPSETNRYPGQANMLDSEVAKREQALRAKKRYPASSGTTLFHQTLEGALPAQKIVIGWKGFDDPFYKVESLVKSGADLFIQEDEASPDNDKLMLDAQMTVPQVLDKLNKSARLIRPRADDEVPTDPGVCIDGAFLSNSLDEGVEVVFFGVRLKEFPDVHLSIETRKIDIPLPEQDTLESLFQRGREFAILSGQGLEYARTKIFRRSARDLNGLAGYEILARKPAHERDTEAHEFHYRYNGEPKNSMKPLIDIQLDTGVQGDAPASRPPSLTDEEAIALWDRLTGSIRVRPTSGPTKTSDAGPPLGTLAATGRACPQSGWWECVEQALPVRGGRRQFFREGERLPPAVLEAERGLWQTLKGDAPSHTVETVWKLVAGLPPAA